MQGKNNGEEENGGQQLQSSFALLEHFPKSIFTCYIPFQSSGSQESNTSNRVRFGAEMRKIWLWKPTALVISYELLEGEVFNSKFCINQLEPISMPLKGEFITWNDFELPIFVASNGAAAGEGATSTVKQPLRLTCDLHHKFEMEIPHEDQSSHYDHEKDKFAYLSMRDRIELGKRQVQQSQWGSKYALNGDDSYEHTVGECPTIPTVRDMYGYQSSYTSVGITIPTLQPNLNLNHQ
ncbi:hypothetical protein CK203_059234 [Vitis vinifera]|uniref:Uncharacterized protein n=1 Tax=Vitis vinifera TaxID=29760 RepID=A0A438GEE2_VITVI|nr:hypothetical protein CK203_059234 [Vitis vinifera]